MRYVVWLILFVLAVRQINAERAKNWNALKFTTLLKWGGVMVWAVLLTALVVGMIQQQKENKLLQIAQEKEQNLTQEERIFRELVHCHDEVSAKLEEQYPTDGNNPIYWSWPIAVSGSFNRNLYEENAYKNAELSKTAYEPCDDMLLKKYQLSTWELKEIRNKWLLENRIWKLGI